MDDDNFIEAIKLNISGIIFLCWAAGVLLGALLTDLFNGPLFAAGIAIILCVSGVVVYSMGVSKRP